MHEAADPRSAGRASRLSTRLLFLICGFGTAAWAPLVPFVKARAGLDDGALGLLLLCLGGGSILAMPAAGALAARTGFRPGLVLSVVLVAATLPVLASAHDVAVLAAALALFGAGMGALDCIMNLQAVAVERAARRPLMSGFHGLYSLGAMLGSAGFAALLALGLSPLAASLVVVAAVAVAFAAAFAGILPGRGGAGPAFALPRGPVLLIGLLCFVVFLAEGSVLDWSAVYLTQARGVEPAYAALGYAAFSVTMTIGRLTGDRVVERLGRRNAVVFGALAAAAGLALATLVPSAAAAFAGYALVGAGCANVVPVLFTAAGNQTAMPTGVAVPAVATVGYAGVLAGPAAIGFLAQATSLSAAFLAVAVALVWVALAGRRLRV